MLPRATGPRSTGRAVLRCWWVPARPAHAGLPSLSPPVTRSHSPSVCSMTGGCEPRQLCRVYTRRPHTHTARAHTYTNTLYIRVHTCTHTQHANACSRPPGWHPPPGLSGASQAEKEDLAAEAVSAWGLANRTDQRQLWAIQSSSPPAGARGWREVGTWVGLQAQVRKPSPVLQATEALSR